MGCPRQELWSGVPCPPPGDLPHRGLKPHPSRLLLWWVGSLPLPAAGEPPENHVRGMYSQQRLGGPWVTQQQQASGGVWEQTEVMGWQTQEGRV